MTLYEGIIILNLAITVFLAYRYAKMSEELDMLYEGVAMTMKEIGLSKE